MLRLRRRRSAAAELPADSAADAAPPAYDAEAPEPPDYASLRLVSVTALAQHLAVLRRFAALEQSARACTAGRLGALSPAARWSAYLKLAAVRLEKWAYLIADAQNRRRSWREQVAALPEDAALVWHAWMVAAPRRYEDDVRRVWWDALVRECGAGRYAPMRDFPLEQLAQRFEGGITPEDESAGKELWARKTGLPWDALETLTAADSTVEIDCPACEAVLKATRQRVSHEALGVKRLLDDLELKPGRIPDSELGWSKAKKLAVEARAVRKLVGGVLPLTHDPTSLLTRPGPRSIVHASLVHEELAKALLEPRAADSAPKAVPTREEVKRLLQRRTELSDRMILHVLSAYTTPHAWSTDVALATHRLSEFTHAVDSLGWLDPSWGASDEGSKALQACLERYKKMLPLVRKPTKKGPLTVPLDIDLVWHTHLLHPSRYRAEAVELAGQYIGHNDAVEESLASEAFDRLAKAWRRRYHEPLSDWAPSQNPLAKGLSRMRKTRRADDTNSNSWPASRPSTHASVLVHTEKQVPRRGRRLEGDLDPPFLRTKSAADQDGEEEGVWAVNEKVARAAGSSILGVDDFSPATCWDKYRHRDFYTPYWVEPFEHLD
ncbi:hypothetical protein JCM8202_002349 [Rhodotorula sphaerocarpa]